MTVEQALKSRRSIRHFDPTVQIPGEELNNLLELANLAPSSMNLQPWDYLVIQSAEDKARLKNVSYGQSKIADASAVIVVLGNLHHYENAQRVAEGNRDRGYFDEAGVEKFVKSANGAWEGKERAQRDEAFRGGNLWAMSFMLAAESKGWSTAPMGGYEEDKLIAEFGVPSTHIPVLLICVGKPLADHALLERGLRISAEEHSHHGNW